MNDSGDGASLAFLIERSAELKRVLVDFACGPRFERHLARLMLDAAGPGGELSEGEAIAVIDRFALQHRLPNGKTVPGRMPGSGGVPGTGYGRARTGAVWAQQGGRRGALVFHQ